MTDASFSATKNVGTKPRLSLLPSKQAGIRLKSEDNPEQQLNFHINKPNVNANIVDASANNSEHQLSQGEKIPIVSENDFQPLNGRTQTDENKMNVSKEDLIRLLTMLKSELQSKEIALAAIKCEQLKRLMNPVEISRSSLASAYIELQDRLKARDQNNNQNSSKTDQLSSSASNGNQRNRSTDTQLKKESDADDQESLNMLSTLLELLDRHPLLALPRDSIYCLDYNCNELSTKNYLNLKIQHLDNLIEQHRRFRYYMAERLKRSEQRYMDLTLELELERNLKLENEGSMYKGGGKSVLLKHINQLKEDLEKEKASKHAIVMALLNDLLDEREKNETLSKKLVEMEKKMAETSKIASTPTSTTSRIKTNQTPPSKPLVPAKPAKLLDQQRNQTKHR